MKNYCYICLLTACMAPMSLQAQKQFRTVEKYVYAPLPTRPHNPSRHIFRLVCPALCRL